jgi:hypothetical protein
MLETYMKNKGTTKTIFHNNNTNIVKEYDWDIDYDGEKAKVSIDTVQNGKPGHYDLEFDNNDLANIFKLNSVKKPINERLLDDFGFNNNSNHSINSINPYIIKIDNTVPLPLEFVQEKPLLLENSKPLQRFEPIEMSEPIEKASSLENILHEFDEMKQNTFKEPPIILDIAKPKLKTRKRRRKYKTRKHIFNPRLPQKIVMPMNISNPVIPQFKKTIKNPKIKIHRVFKIPKT